MKPHTIILGGIMTVLLAVHASAQIILLNPGSVPGIISSKFDNYNNGLTLKLEFNFSYAPSEMSLKVTNLGDLSQPANTYKLTQLGFNAPSAWGTVTLATPYPSNLGDTVTSLTTKANLFGGNGFSTWAGSRNANQGSELDIDVSESATLIFSFTAAPALNFDLEHFFDSNGSPDMGFRIQPISLINDRETTSDKWVYNYTTPFPSDIPLPRPVPEPTTYGLLGMVGLASLIGYRRLRRKA